MNPKVKEGDKIVLVYMNGEQGMTPGTKGTVMRVNEDPFEKGEQLISVKWENGRSLAIVSSEDLWIMDSKSEETINENYGDLGELTFKKMWYSPEYGDSVYFGDFDEDINSISSSTKIKLTDSNSDDEYYFEPGMLKTTRNRNALMVKMRDFRKLYPQESEKLHVKQDTKTNEKLDVNTLKRKTSGVPETILNTLKEVYPNNWGRISEPNCETLDGVIDIFPAIEGERWSILNFFDTNPGVIRLLVDKYMNESDSHTQEGFKQWIVDNKEDLFGESSLFLQDLIKRNKQSFKSGWKLESDVIDIIKKENPSLTDKDITQFCLGSIKDRVSSIDVSVNGKGYQIKPSSKMERLKDGGIKVYTHGMRDWYKNKVREGLNYILYSNGKNIVVFPNEKYWVSKDGKSTIHYNKPLKNTFTQSLTEQTKDDLISKVEDKDMDISSIQDLLSQLSDEDITGQFLRNLDRKFFKGGDKEKNIRDYLEKYIESLSNREEMDPNDDFDVEDEFLYGGVEPEKSKIGRKTFKKEVLPLQVELLKLQEDVKKTGKSIVVVFEGRDSAGKGSTIKKMVEYLDPKYFNVIALGLPTEEDKKDWFGRYEKHIESGKINFFDRSWYNRGIVEPVMGYSSEEEYLDFMENVNGFEQSLIDRGVELVKFWLSITPETQKKRFEMRKASPLKYWKFSPNDEKSIDKWDEYTEYKNRVMKQTREAKPWTVVDTNDKRAGILNAFRHLLKVVNYEGKEVENIGPVYPEVVTTIKEKEINEGGNHHWTDWEKVSDVLGMENKILYDFFEKLRISSVMNMLESTHFIYSGADYLKRYIQYNEYENYDESKYEDLYDAADQAKDAMIRLSIESLERKDKELSLENMNKEVRHLAKQALTAFIMMK